MKRILGIFLFITSIIYGSYGSDCATERGGTSVQQSSIVPVVKIPNVFTPEKNTNSIFKVSTMNSIEINGVVFNKFGKQIYKWNSQSEIQGWDGNTIDKKNAPEGKYYYVITIIGKDHKAYEYKGIFHLNR